MSTQILEAPNLILTLDMFPDNVTIINLEEDTYLFWSENGIRGLACFENEREAFFWLEFIDGKVGGKPIDLSFDSAREVALAKSKVYPNIVALHLLAINKTTITHYIK